MLPINPTAPLQPVLKSVNVNLPPLNLSRLSQKSGGKETGKNKASFEQQSLSQLQLQYHKDKKKWKGGREMSLGWGGSLQYVNNDLYDHPLPESDPFYDDNSIDSFDLEYLSRNVNRISVGTKGRSGYREGDYKSGVLLSGIEEKANYDEVLYGGSPNLSRSSSIYKEEKESDVPTHFDLEYFTRMHDDTTSKSKSKSKSKSTAVFTKSDRNSKNHSDGGKTITIRAQSVPALANSSSSVLSSNSISPISPTKPGKGPEKGQWWTDALTPDNDDCTVVSIASHHSSSLYSGAAGTGKPSVLFDYSLWTIHTDIDVLYLFPFKTAPAQSPWGLVRSPMREDFLEGGSFDNYSIEEDDGYIDFDLNHWN